MNVLGKILGILIILLSITSGMYIWLWWGWYDGGVEAFNAIMIEPKSVINFMIGVLRIIFGGAIGYIFGLIATVVALSLANKNYKV